MHNVVLRICRGRGTDNVNGLDIGTLEDSIEEWRMRARGAKVASFANFSAAIAAVEEPTSPVDGLVRFLIS